MCLDFQPGTKDLGPSSSGLKPSSLEARLERFLVSKSVPSTGCWQWVVTLGSLTISDKHHARMDSLPHKDRLGVWCCRTCFWGKSNSPTHRHVYSYEESMCVLWGKENIMRIFWLESDIVSLMICLHLTNSTPFKYSFACQIRCWTHSCGCLLKCRAFFRGRCIFKLCGLLPFHFVFSSPSLLSVRRFWVAFRSQTFPAFFLAGEPLFVSRLGVLVLNVLFCWWCWRVNSSEVTVLQGALGFSLLSDTFVWKIPSLIEVSRHAFLLINFYLFFFAVNMAVLSLALLSGTHERDWLSCTS